MNKHFINAEALLLDSFKLARKIHDDGYYPDIILGLWRGGSPITIAVHEYFTYQGRSVEHFPIKVSAYQQMNQQKKQVDVQELSDLFPVLKEKKQVLIVDDVFDTGNSITALLKGLHVLLNGLPIEIKIATPWYKPDNNQGKNQPDYYLYTTNEWLVFPHELCGLSKQELQANNPTLAQLL